MVFIADAGLRERPHRGSVAGPDGERGLPVHHGVEREEHTMIDFLTANWLWIVLIGAFVLMHTRGGGCGMHGGHHRGGHDRISQRDTEPTPGQSREHDHAARRSRL